MARTANPNSANSQFFICFTDDGCSFLTGQYTVWGQVTEGMEHVDAIAKGEPPASPDKIIKASIAADTANDTAAAAPAEKAAPPAPAAEPAPAPEAPSETAENAPKPAEGAEEATEAEPAAGEAPSADDEDPAAAAE
jgi:cyclophilin family peptidyl-prolyl cis-trans isomerase